MDGSKPGLINPVPVVRFHLPLPITHRELVQQSSGLLSRKVRARIPGDAPLGNDEVRRPKAEGIANLQCPMTGRIRGVFRFRYSFGLRGFGLRFSAKSARRSGPTGRGVPLRTGRLKVRILPVAPLFAAHASCLRILEASFRQSELEACASSLRSVNRPRSRAAVPTRTRPRRLGVQVHGAPLLAEAE